MRLLIRVTTLISVLGVVITSASSSSARQDVETQAKNPIILEKQFAEILAVYKQDFKNEMENVKSQLQAEIEHLQSQLQIEKTKSWKSENDLKAKLDSVSEEMQALKTELILLFNKMSNFKPHDHSSPGLKPQEAEHQGQGSTEIDIDSLNPSLMPGFSEDNTTNADENHLTLSISSTGGVSYIRWGRTTCERDAKVLYKGFVGHKRGHTSNIYPGSDYICLHNSPQWEGYHAPLRDWSTISGVEYGMPADDPFSTENNGDQPLFNNDMLCTVCHVSARSHQLMIPGRKSCPTGWTLEYWGYLATSSSYTGENGSPYVCLDYAPESEQGGNGEGQLPHIYAVEAFCRGVICPPYKHGYEITCAVCSK